VILTIVLIVLFVSFGQEIFPFTSGHHYITIYCQVLKAFGNKDCNRFVGDMNGKTKTQTQDWQQKKTHEMENTP